MRSAQIRSLTSIAVLVLAFLLPTMTVAAQSGPNDVSPAPPPPDVSVTTTQYGPCIKTVTTTREQLGGLSHDEISAVRSALQYNHDGSIIEPSRSEFLALPERVQEILSTPTILASEKSDTSCDFFASSTSRDYNSGVGGWRYVWEWSPWIRSCSRINNRIWAEIAELGVELLYAQTTIRWACAKSSTGAIHDGTNRAPKVRREMGAGFGVFACGWYRPFERYYDGGRRFAVGGNAGFDLVSETAFCFPEPTMYVHSFITVDGTLGPWLSWWILRPVGDGANHD